MLRRLVVVLTLITVSGAVAGLSPAHGDDDPGAPPSRAVARLTMTAPDSVSTTTVKVKGSAPARTQVLITGGAAPARTMAGRKGWYAVRVPLLPAVTNRLVARVILPTKVLRTARSVRQVDSGGTGSVSGRVVDTTGAPVAGAAVDYGTHTTQTGADGGYTLGGLPKGAVAVHASADGYVDGVAMSAGGSAEVLLTPLADPILVTPDEGGSAEGNGYRFDVPPGAVTEPTEISVTPLTFSGPADAWGLPYIDVSPTMSFAQPVSITIDPSVFGAVDYAGPLTGFDPATGATRILPTTASADGLVVELDDVRGEEVRVPADPNDFGTPCTPYPNQLKAGAVRLAYFVALPPFLGAKIGATSAEVYGLHYFGLGPADPSYAYEVTSQGDLDQFADPAYTLGAMVKTDIALRNALKTGPVPALRDPFDPAKARIKDFGVGQDVHINYNAPFTVPGNIAGDGGPNPGDTPGISSPDLGSVLDRRDIDGDITFVPEASGSGVLQKVTAEASYELEVKDSVDFCPGDFGASIEAYATVALSRLEVTSNSVFGGHFTKPTFIHAKTDLKNPDTGGAWKYDVTARYPSNDRDLDGVPDAQPWDGATYTLDNCPDTPNPGQLDSNGNGVGDACDACPNPRVIAPKAVAPTDDCDPDGGGGGGGGSDGGDAPDNGPRDPGSGGSLGDPHLLTFDHTLYDFNGGGDYVAARDTSGDFEVQFRFARNPDGYLPQSISYNRGVAARVGDSVITFGDTRSTDPHAALPAALDGEPLTVTTTPTVLPGGAVVYLDPTRHDIGGTQRIVQWPDGTRLAVGPKAAYAYANLTLSDARKGDVHGLLGDADGDSTNDLTARDGTVITDPTDLDQMYGVFGPSWRATGSASLFRHELPDSIRLPIRPTAIPAIAALPASATEPAQTTCEAQGLVTGWGLEQCILDVAVTGDDAFAGNTALVATQIGGTVNEALVTATPETTKTLTVDSTASGSLDRRFAVDEFRIQLNAGETFRMDAGGTCPHPGTFAVALIAPSGRPIDRSTAAGCGHFGVTNLTESGTYLVRVQDVGGYKGSYAFTVSGGSLGLTCTANNVGPNDDDSSPELALPFPVDFFGQSFTSVWVNTNGNVTFDGPMSTYVPEDLTTATRPIVAAFWDDVDTRSSTGGQVRYGVGSVDGRQAFCVRYDAVAHYAQLDSDTARNTFRLYLVDRSDVAAGDFDIVFQYGSIQWNYRGAGVGYTNGTQAPGTYLEVPGSRTTTAFLDGTPTSLVTSSAGGGAPGVRVYQVR